MGGLVGVEQWWWSWAGQVLGLGQSQALPEPRAHVAVCPVSGSVTLCRGTGA